MRGVERCRKVLWGDGDLHVATNWKQFLGWSTRLDGDGVAGKHPKDGKITLSEETNLIMIQENTAFLSSQ